MKKSCFFLLGMVSLAITFGLILTGCPTDTGDNTEIADGNGGNSNNNGGGITPVESGAFTSAAGDNKLVITLTGGTFAASPAIGQFTISAAGTGGFAALTGGTVTRNSNTQVTISGLTAVTTAGSGQKITVAAAAQVTQATSVSVTASSDANGLTWTAVEDTKFGTTSISGIAYGGGKFVAVGGRGAAYSTDGVTWTAVEDTTFVAHAISGIAYGGGKFVAVGHTSYIFYNGLWHDGFWGKAAYSTDGETWWTVGSDTISNHDIDGIAYGGGKFVAWSNYGRAAYSTDGVTWTVVAYTTFDSGGYINGLAFGGGKFVAVGYTRDTYPYSNTIWGKAAYSADGGVTWTAVSDTKFDTNTIDGIAYGGGKFVAVGSSGKAAYSTDGVTWTASDAVFEYGSIDGIAYGGGKFVAVGYDGKVAYSNAQE
jgi:hypothetical protein